MPNRRRRDVDTRGVRDALRHLRVRRPHLVAQRLRAHALALSDMAGWDAWAIGLQVVAFLLITVALFVQATSKQRASRLKNSKQVEATLFIDDKAENIEGAKTAGWHGIRFIDAAQLERDLARYGITV